VQELVNVVLTNQTFASFSLETIDGTATAKDDYVAKKDTLVFKPGETSKHVAIEIIDDNQWEEDEVFFVKLSVYDASDKQVVIGHQSITEVTIINDDGRYNLIYISVPDRSFSLF
jgi:solute carrier family 8 (sodium/calcium exchanger)